MGQVDVIARNLAKPTNMVNRELLKDRDAQHLTYFALRSRFGKASKKVGENFQFRDL